jgi:hypothetical protein
MRRGRRMRMTLMDMAVMDMTVRVVMAVMAVVMGVNVG